MLLNPGDELFVECPTYFTGLSQIQTLGIKPVGINTDGSYLKPDKQLEIIRQYIKDGKPMQV